MNAELPTIYADSREAWRQWLEENHRASGGVWLVYFKVGSGTPSVRYEEAVKEALCFGWIDSKVQSLDGERYRQIFTPRKGKSVWSKLNKRYIEELVAQGIMTQAGLEKIDAAKRDGSWTTLDASENLEMPPDLEQALAANVEAGRYFARWSNSSRKNILFWIQSAKRLETRAKRIKETVNSADKNQKPNSFR